MSSPTYLASGLRILKRVNVQIEADPDVQAELNELTEEDDRVAYMLHLAYYLGVDDTISDFNND